MKVETYGYPLPGLEDKEFPGKLIVLEGTDGVGRSTQAALLKKWLESSGLAVFDTGLTRSVLAGRHIQQAKQGHTMGRKTQCLYYATDFADRLENQMVPALRAGFVVLTDRYIYSLIARAAVRGMSEAWLKDLFGFALKPDAIFYLKPTLESLVPRVLASGGFDYWESGMDIYNEETMYHSFIKYQRALLAEYDGLMAEYGATVIDANQSITQIFEELKQHVSKVVSDMVPGGLDVEELLSRPPMLGDIKDLPRDTNTLDEDETLLKALKAFFSDLMNN